MKQMHHCSLVCAQHYVPISQEGDVTLVAITETTTLVPYR